VGVISDAITILILVRGLSFLFAKNAVRNSYRNRMNQQVVGRVRLYPPPPIFGRSSMLELIWKTILLLILFKAFVRSTLGISAYAATGSLETRFTVGGGIFGMLAFGNQRLEMEEPCAHRCATNRTDLTFVQPILQYPYFTQKLYILRCSQLPHDSALDNILHYCGARSVTVGHAEHSHFDSVGLGA
jgi:hypothetical protein